MRRAALLVVPGLVLLAAGTPELPAQEIRFPVEEARLENGLRILAVEDHAVAAVTYFTFFRVGSRNEHPGRTGISHLFEHLMFNGARQYGPGEFDRQLESRGGSSNAFTAEDVTGYYESFPSEALELVIEMEADRMAALQITVEGLAAEREVVKEERRLRVDNDLQGAMDELLNATAYLAHPYGWPVIGWMADLDAITLEDCRAFFKSYYAPSNAFVVVVGDIRPQKLFDLMRRAFGGLPAQPLPASVVRNEPPQEGERRTILRKPAQLPAVAIAFHVPGTAGGDEVRALDLIETLLGEGDAARLNRILVRERKLASRIDVNNAYRIDPSLFTIVAEARPGVPIERLEQAILAELDRLGREPATEQELQRARNVRTMTLARSLKTGGGKAEQLGVHEVYFGSYARLFEAAGRYAAIDAGALQRAAAAAFRADNRSLVILLPEAGETTP